MNLHSFEENKQMRSEKGIHFEDVMFTFTRSLRLVTLFYANAFMSFSAVTCGILVVFCFYIKFSCVFMFFQIKINHRFEPHRYHFRNFRIGALDTTRLLHITFEGILPDYIEGAENEFSW